MRCRRCYVTGVRICHSSSLRQWMMNDFSRRTIHIYVRAESVGMNCTWQLRLIMRPFPCESGGGSRASLRSAPFAHPCASEGQDGGILSYDCRRTCPLPNPPPLRKGGNSMHGTLTLVFPGQQFACARMTRRGRNIDFCLSECHWNFYSDDSSRGDSGLLTSSACLRRRRSRLVGCPDFWDVGKSSRADHLSTCSRA